jgi:hypothetical protein
MLLAFRKRENVVSPADCFDRDSGSISIVFRDNPQKFEILGFTGTKSARVA